VTSLHHLESETKITMDPIDVASIRNGNVLPSQEALHAARNALIRTLPSEGLGESETQALLQQSITPALSGSSQTANYYGFVTGGATPIAKAADNIVTAFDQNVQVHLPNETVATDVEDAALRLLCQLLRLDENEFKHRTFTTGATASNVMGMACGRQWILHEAAKKRGINNHFDLCDVGNVGISAAMRFAGVERVQILTTVPHSSLAKAASIVGLGRAAIKLVNRSDALHKFDLEALEQALSEPKTASIVAVSCSEVNTGLFATTSDEMKAIRALCDEHRAWLHVDGAFGIMGRCLDSKPAYDTILEGCAGMELADSITGDGHKLLNVPYDCGFFLSKHLDIAFHVFQNAGAAYLATAPSADGVVNIPSPLNHGLENSRRFRALPVYANLVAYGRTGYQEMLERQITLARRIAAFIGSHNGYEILPAGPGEQDIFMIVLFRAADEKLNAELVKRINGTSKIYVSGTSWEGKPACRFAVSNWQVDVERDVGIIQNVLSSVWQERGTS
jgi:glutamate/tyrosine decarboxylase-like PLP-dependent enzyme